MRKESKNTDPYVVEDAIATAEALFSLGLSEAQAVVRGLTDSARRRFAQRLTTSVLAKLSSIKLQAAESGLSLRTPLVPALKNYPGLIRRLSDALLQLTDARAGFLVGQLYTALLPDSEQKKFGAYYTPPALVDRLLDLVDQADFDWANGSIVDPACGGAAFLAPLATRMAERSRRRGHVRVLTDIEDRLCGAEIDPFAAWISQVLLDIALRDLSKKVGRLPRVPVMTLDSLRSDRIRKQRFDLVIGNPPYGKITLPSQERENFKRSLFGHANLYGLFTDLAVDLAKDSGLIAFVTPTSFLGGEYFKNLRRLLSELAPLSKLDFVNDREGVFQGVLQETLLAIFDKKRTNRTSRVDVNLLHPEGRGEGISVERIGEARNIRRDGGPWLLPRSKPQSLLVRRMGDMPRRLSDYGFGVSTGQLVWNRHKSQLRAEFEPDSFPIIWAEAVAADGSFEFQAARRNHLPYLSLDGRQHHLVNHEPCILVQRTTAKEQRRRIISAVIPNSFVLEYPGYVVENHLNMVYRTNGSEIGFAAVAALLNSHSLDQAFRCINGSVAVSAYELNALPLPNPDQMTELQDALDARVNHEELEELISSFYLYRNGTRRHTTPVRHTRSRNRKLVA